MSISGTSTRALKIYYRGGAWQQQDYCSHAHACMTWQHKGVVVNGHASCMAVSRGQAIDHPWAYVLLLKRATKTIGGFQK